MLLTFQIQHNGVHQTKTNSTDQVISTLKSLGVKGLDKKKEPKKWINKGSYHYVGIKGEVSLIVN